MKPITKPIILVGTGRCGSTVFHRILATHPQAMWLSGFAYQFPTRPGINRRAVAAMTLALGLPMAWYLASTYHRPLMIWVCRAYLAVGVLAIGLTGSRGGLLTTVVALTIVPLTMTRLSPKRMVAMVSMLFLAGALAVAYVPEQIVKRLATTSTEVEDLRGGGRIKMWRAGIRAFPLHPILGYGTSGFIRAVTPELGPGALVAHNSFISLLVEQGVIGLTLYLLMDSVAARLECQRWQ